MQYFFYNYYLISEPLSWGQWACELINRLLILLPETPFSLASLTSDFAMAVPSLGSGLIYMVSQDLFSVLSLVVVYKILKLRFWSL